MLYTKYLMAFARDLPNVVSPELINFLGRRLENEGVVSFAKGMNDVHDCLLRALTVGSNTIPPTYIPQGSLPDWVSQPAQALDFFGMFNKLQVQGQICPAPWDSFISRNREVTNFDGAPWEDILPLPRGYDKWIRREMGAAPTTVFCKHGPGATAERLSGWDKWLPFIQNRSSDLSIRMVDVPKDTKTRRIIGIEPVKRQFVQQGVSHALRHTQYFRKYIDLHNQHTHANFACGDELVTIDLKDASDRIPLSLLDYLLPADWAHLIRATSTGNATLPCGDGIRLGMVATMGCGFCFEVETLLFHLVAGLISSSCTLTLANSLRSCRVYGDDLILNAQWVPAWSHFCNQAGWIMSDKKTMLTPKFKETVGFWIVDGKPRQRFLPQLAGTSSSLTLSVNDKLCLASRAMLAGYGHLTSAIVADVTLPVRWEKSLQHWEVQVRMSSHSHRVLTVTEETRWLAYWKCGLCDQLTEDLPTMEDHDMWIPMETHAVLGTVISPVPSLPVHSERVYALRM
jgi:hypothetical protein